MTWSASKEKIGSDQLLHKLADWFVGQKPQWIERLREYDNDKVDRWLSENQQALEKNDFANVNLPRVVLSYFLDELLYDCLEKAKDLNVAVELIEAKVSSVERSHNGFNVYLEDVGSTVEIKRDSKGDFAFHENDYQPSVNLEVDDVVLATGLPGKKDYPHLEDIPGYFSTHTTQPEDAKSRHLMITDMIESIHQKTGKKVNVASIGMGPSFLDVAMLLDRKKLKEKFVLTGFSSTGKLRHNSAETTDNTDYQPIFLFDFSPDNSLSPSPVRFDDEDQFFGAVSEELLNAYKTGFGSIDVECIAERYLAEIKKTESPHYNPDLYKGVRKERGRVKLRNRLRQTDQNTARTVSRLQQQGNLVKVSNRVGTENISPKAEGQQGFLIEIVDHQGNYDIVINCSPRRNSAREPLLRQCVNENLVEVTNDNGLDLVHVDQHNRTTGGIYLGGAKVVNYIRDGERITGDVGVGAIMRHAKRISSGIVEDMQQRASSKILFIAQAEDAFYEKTG